MLVSVQGQSQFHYGSGDDASLGGSRDTKANVADQIQIKPHLNKP